MIELDRSNGNMLLNGEIFFSRFMKPQEILTIFHGRDISIHVKENSVFYRFDPVDSWFGILVEFISIEFNSARCRELSISLVASEDRDIRFVQDVGITRYLQTSFNDEGVMVGRSKVDFSLSWGKATVIYDIKLSAPSVLLALNK